MREIKFRAWDGRNERYFEISEFSNDQGEIYGALDGQTVVESEHLILEQYIGVKDVNGNEIYEGDIIFDTRVKDYNVVKFHKGAWTFNNSNDLIGYFDNELKVVGNIHENPELLEVE